MVKPSFNFEGKKAQFCQTHMLPGMVNVADRKCLAPGCKKLPTYGIPGLAP